MSMRISTLIKVLEVARERAGDVDVVMQGDQDGESLAILSCALREGARAVVLTHTIRDQEARVVVVPDNGDPEQFESIECMVRAASKQKGVGSKQHH